MAMTLFKLREALKKADLNDKLIGYTTRFNAFWDDSSRPEGVNAWASDGEGLKIESVLKA